MGCHALLQGIFPTQGLNPYTDIFYQKSTHPFVPGALLGKVPKVSAFIEDSFQMSVFFKADYEALSCSLA